MDNLLTNSLASPVRTLQVSGINIHLDKLLRHSLHIKFSVDDMCDVVGLIVLKRKEEQLGGNTRSLPVSLTLPEGSTLTVRVQRKHRWFRTYKALVSPKFPFDNIGSGRDSETPDSQIERLTILNDHKKRIWLNTEMPSSMSRQPTNDPNPIEVPQPPDPTEWAIEVISSTPRPSTRETDPVESLHTLENPPDPPVQASEASSATPQPGSIGAEQNHSQKNSSYSPKQATEAEDVENIDLSSSTLQLSMTEKSLHASWNTPRPPTQAFEVSGKPPSPTPRPSANVSIRNGDLNSLGKSPCPREPTLQDTEKIDQSSSTPRPSMSVISLHSSGNVSDLPGKAEESYPLGNVRMLSSPLSSGPSESNLHSSASTVYLGDNVAEPLKATSDAVMVNLTTFEAVLDYLNRAVRSVPVNTFADAVSQLNLIAYDVRSSIIVFYEQIDPQGQIHEVFLALVESMAGTIDHIQPVKFFIKLDELKVTLKLFYHLMQDTTNFIKTYVEKSIPANISLLPEYRYRVNVLRRRCASFREEFDQAFKEDEGPSRRALDDLSELERLLLTGIKSIDPRAIKCIPNTRKWILDDIIAETGNSDNPNVIWVRGAPGSGKSSISLNVKSLLLDQGRLVTYFRFDRNEATTTTSIALWRFVAYDFARRLPSVRIRLLHQIRHSKMDLDSPQVVFNTLVEAPLAKSIEASPDQPYVVLIDGIDECGGFAGRLSTDREVLLETLRQWSKLPKHFKVLVTSREDGDISRMLSSISLPIDIPSGDILTKNPQAQVSIHATNDVRTFLKERFRLAQKHFPSLPKDWPGAGTVDTMVYRAAGNFMWATAAADFIDCRGINPQSRLNRTMCQRPESSGMKPLYSLYVAILETAFGDIDDLEAATLRSVLGVMVIAKRPLRDVDYTRLPTQPVTITKLMLNSIRDGLHSVVTPGASISFAHTTFADFLLSSECPSKYRIQKNESHHLLTKLCLETMKKGLCFNICDLETSCLKNADIPNFEAKAAKGIPGLLSYSCCFFADHLSCIPFYNDNELMSELKAIFLDKLLYWFEVMSLLGEMNRVSHSLLSVLKWAHLSPDDGFKDFVQDARRFIGAFGQPMAQSAPHIYISALPFAPEYSSVARHFRPRFPQVLELSRGKPDDWPSCIFSSEYQRAEARSVAFSPDDKHFVSGSADQTICICDSETGIRVLGPFGDDHGVLRVSFDQTGNHILAGCGDDDMISIISAWSIETGDRHVHFQAGSTVGRTFGHSSDGIRNTVSTSQTQEVVTLWSADADKQLRDVLTNATIYTFSFSPDGFYMALLASIGSGDSDTIVRMWKLAATRSKIQVLSQLQTQFKHTSSVSTLSFSVDGNFMVSGSENGTIVIWDSRTGDTIGDPLVTGKSRLDAVAYSPQTSLLVSASGKYGTVMVWHAFRREAVLGPLAGHTLWISEVSLSYDGRRLLSTSLDRTVRMWDLDRRRVVPASGSSNGHTTAVLCLTFSPCGTKLASLGDMSIRVWDMSYDEVVHIDCNSIISDYSRIIFAPDGSQIVAYDSTDGTVRAWNAATGQLDFYKDLQDGGPEFTRIEHLTFRETDCQPELITCSSNGVVRVCNLKSGVMTECCPVSSPQPKHVSTIIALSPDGTSLIAHDHNKKPHHHLWSITEHQPHPLTFDDDEFISGYRVAYSPSGKFFATVHDTRLGSGSSMLRVWNTRTGKLVAPPSKFDNAIGCLAFSPDDRHIALSYPSPSHTGITAIYAWVVDTGRPVPGWWKGHNDSITALAFSPDGERLVSGSKDGQIKIWNTQHMFGSSESQVSDGVLGVGTDMQDGWVIDANGNLLFWVPKDHRTKLMWPGNIAAIGRSGVTTELDLTRFSYGKNWAKCFKRERTFRHWP